MKAPFNKESHECNNRAGSSTTKQHTEIQPLAFISEQISNPDSSGGKKNHCAV